MLPAPQSDRVRSPKPGLVSRLDDGSKIGRGTSIESGYDLSRNALIENF